MVLEARWSHICGRASAPIARAAAVVRPSSDRRKNPFHIQIFITGGAKGVAAVATAPAAATTTPPRIIQYEFR